MKTLNRNCCSTIWIGSAALALAVSGCATNAPAHDASESAVNSHPYTAEGTPQDDRKITVQISKALRERCKLPEDTRTAPSFEFDESALHTGGRNVLDDVARCLVGALKDEAVTVIGRTDDQGSNAYNKNLATNRAAAARDYLVSRGVATDRVHLMSRGETGARGDDEESRALDRRVDLELGDLKSSPILQGTMIHEESAPAPKKSKAGTYADTSDGPVVGSPTGNANAAGSSK
jgi:outer membrane protein OmpA-like peptidoglycan-associated protein